MRTHAEGVLGDANAIGRQWCSCLAATPAPFSTMCQRPQPSRRTCTHPAGVLGDAIGRQWGSRLVASFMLSGTLMLTFTALVPNASAYFAFFLFALTWWVIQVSDLNAGLGWGEGGYAGLWGIQHCAPTSPTLPHLATCL